MSPYTVNMTYEPFAKEPEYIEANRAFIATMDLSSARVLLDLACGIGTMTGLLFDQKPDLRVSGMDLSLESLCIARENLGSAVVGDRWRHVALAQATADRLPVGSLAVDTVIMGNAIHLIPDLNGLLQEIHRVLQPGGLFAFNSSFYAGTMPAGTEAVHHEWIKQAVQYIVTKDKTLRQEGREGIPRKRGTAAGAFSQPWLSPGQWEEQLRKHGFEVQTVHERTVHMTQRNFETIGAYGGFAKVILSGYPVPEASEALQATAGPALATMNLETVPRLWLEVTARKSQ